MEDEIEEQGEETKAQPELNCNEKFDKLVEEMNNSFGDMRIAGKRTRRP